MIHRVLRFAVGQGLDTAPLLAETGFTKAELDNRELLIPLAKAMALFDAVATALHDPTLGLSMAKVMAPTDYGLVGLLWEHHPTLDAALDALAHYYTAFLAGAEMRVLREAGRTRLVHRFLHEHRGLDYLRQESLASVYLNAVAASATHWTPMAVTFRQQPADPKPFVDVFGVMPTFGASDDALIIDPVHLTRPNPRADSELLNHLLEAAETHLVRRRNASGAKSRVLLLRGCSADLTSGMVHRGNDTLTLTTKERELLVYLADHMNEVVTHEAIERDVWGIGKSVISHAPAVAIRRLRQKIEPQGPKPVNLVTVFGEGWKLVVPESS
jgi:hypothetical protein